METDSKHGHAWHGTTDHMHMRQGDSRTNAQAHSGHNVAGLAVPGALLDAYDKKSQRERAAWQKRFDVCMQEQRQSSLASYETEDQERDYCKVIAR